MSLWYIIAFLLGKSSFPVLLFTNRTGRGIMVMPKRIEVCVFCASASVHALFYFITFIRKKERSNEKNTASYPDALVMSVPMCL